MLTIKLHSQPTINILYMHGSWGWIARAKGLRWSVTEGLSNSFYLSSTSCMHKLNEAREKLSRWRMYRYVWHMKLVSMECTWIAFNQSRLPGVHATLCDASGQHETVTSHWAVGLKRGPQCVLCISKANIASCHSQASIICLGRSYTLSCCRKATAIFLFCTMLCATTDWFPPNVYIRSFAPCVACGMCMLCAHYTQG